MSTINMVKYYFYKGMMPMDLKETERIIALAYQTAIDKRLYPQSILIRSKHHNTTTINGKVQKDPKGWHLTFCYKDQIQALNQKHVACHGYTDGPFSYDLIESTHAGEKPDAVRRKRNNKPVWPPTAQLDEAPEIGYSHIPKPSET